MPNGLRETERVSFGTVLFLVGEEEAGVVGFFAVFCVRAYSGRIELSSCLE
jgi:hypothetical protein